MLLSLVLLVQTFTGHLELITCHFLRSAGDQQWNAVDFNVGFDPINQLQLLNYE